MPKTITLCSGKGGVGKTVLATCLARIIQQEEHCPVLLVDLDPSVQGLTLLMFQSKYELDHVPLALAEYLDGGDDIERDLFEALRKALSGDGHPGTLYSLYRRFGNIFVLPFSTESERPNWSQSARLDFAHIGEKLHRLLTFAAESLHIGYIIFDTQAGPGNFSLAAAIVSDVNLIVLEEDDISWRTALSMLLEISDLNKRLQKRSRSYFLANKAGPELQDAIGKLKAFSFLPPLPYDAWMQKLLARATSIALEKEFENTDFFRQARSRVWHELASIFGVASPTTKDSFALTSWWRRRSDKPSQRPAAKVTTPPRLQLPGKAATPTEPRPVTKPAAAPAPREGGES